MTKLLMVLALMIGCDKTYSSEDLLISKNLVPACMKVPKENIVTYLSGSDVQFDVCRTATGDIFVCAHNHQAGVGCVALAFVKDPWVRVPVTPEAN